MKHHNTCSKVKRYQRDNQKVKMDRKYNNGQKYIFVKGWNTNNDLQNTIQKTRVSNTSTTNTGVERMLSIFFSTSGTCRDNNVHINLLSYFFLQAFKSKPDRFADFFYQILQSCLSEDRPFREQSLLLLFLIHCFNSLVRFIWAYPILSAFNQLD